jgi:hypothetical protein
MSRIAPPSVAAADARVDSANVSGTGGAVLVCATGLAGVALGGNVAGGVGTGGGGGGGASGQSAIVRVSVPELELPSRVSDEDHDDDAVATPLPLGIATVSENELPANDAPPCFVAVGPAVGLNTITHCGVLSPPLPLPEELKSDQSKVTDLQVAVAVTMCACALAAKNASNTTASGMMLRER